MLLDRQTNVALSILLTLARRQDEALPARGLARVIGVSLRSLARLLLRLREAGLVAIRGGRRGGYVLARSPWAISLSDVVDACGGATPAFDLSLAQDDGLRAGLGRMNERLRSELSRTRLAHVAATCY